MAPLRITQKIFATLLLSALYAQSAFAWMGFDRETDARIEIGEGNLTRNGLEIRIYDWADNQYHRVTITSFNENSARTEIEVFDEETGEERIFDMERSK